MTNRMPEEKQVPVFLNIIGASTYSLLQSLLAPDNLKDKSITELKTELRTYFELK